MDTNMEDVTRAASDEAAAPTTSLAADAPAIPVLDSWIDGLMNCKQLVESDVQRLCEKVS
jgi:serine/threonine-protein phosphatase 2A catalytic subunit